MIQINLILDNNTIESFYGLSFNPFNVGKIITHSLEKDGKELLEIKEEEIILREFRTMSNYPFRVIKETKVIINYYCEKFSGTNIYNIF